MFKPNLSAAQIQSALDQVNHKTVRKVREKRFDLKEEGLTEQSIAWLFCWAKTGMNSKSAQAESHNAFNRIFAQGPEDLFKQLDSLEGFHDYARKVRASKKNIAQDFNLHVGEALLKKFNGEFAEAFMKDGKTHD